MDSAKDGLPWNKNANQWTDTDDANLRVWLEKHYDITGKEKIADALTASTGFVCRKVSIASK